MLQLVAEPDGRFAACMRDALLELPSPVQYDKDLASAVLSSSDEAGWTVPLAGLS